MIITAGVQMIFEFIGGIVGMIPDLLVAGGQLILALGQGMLEAIPNVLTGAWDGIKSGFSSMWDFVTGKGSEGTQTTKTQFEQLNLGASTSTSQMATNVGNNATNATNALSTASSTANITGTTNYSTLASNVSGSMAGMSSNVLSEIDLLFEWINSFNKRHKK